MSGAGPAGVRPVVVRSAVVRSAVVRTAVVVAAVVGTAAVWTVLVAPAALGLHGTPLVAQAVALRGVGVAAALLVALVTGGLALRSGRGGLVRRLLAVVAVGAAAVAVGHGVVLADRGLVGWAGGRPAPAAEDHLVVLVLNTQGAVSGEAVAALTAERGADVVALPETSAATAERAAAALDRPYRVLAATGTGGLNPSTAALVATDLGSYRVVSTSLPSTFTAVGDGPALTVVHTRAPVDPDLVWWADSTRAAVEACSAHPGGLVAGDFNATTDHPAFGALGPCVDATSAAGVGGVGTWPTLVPRLLGAPIDHVLVDPEHWQVLRAAVLDPPTGTDHRAVEVVLRPTGR